MAICQRTGREFFGGTVSSARAYFLHIAATQINFLFVARGSGLKCKISLLESWSVFWRSLLFFDFQ
jgi:hypothetical protein